MDTGGEMHLFNLFINNGLENVSEKCIKIKAVDVQL
jgi:hypothetical protein